jgi:hypothetical protein
MTQKTEAMKRIGQFVKGLEGTAREVILRVIAVPNSSDCQLEVLGLMGQYGDAYIRSTGEIENLRQDLGADYDWIQFQLKREFYEQAVTEGFVRVAKQNDYPNWKPVPKPPIRNQITD